MWMLFVLSLSTKSCMIGKEKDNGIVTTSERIQGVYRMKKRMRYSLILIAVLLCCLTLGAYSLADAGNFSGSLTGVNGIPDAEHEAIVKIAANQGS